MTLCPLALQGDNKMLPAFELKDLVRDCEECQGYGMTVRTSGNYSEQIDCPTCKGEKLIFTPAGKVLADFIKKLRSVGRLG